MRSALVVAVLLLAAAPAVAADDLDERVEAVNRAGAAPASEAATVATIARAVDREPAALRAEQARVGLPWGDVFVSHRIATRGGHPLEKVFAARKTGASWTAIAEEAKVDAASLARDLTAAFQVPAPGASAPTGAAAPKPGLAQRFLELFRGAPSSDSTEDWERTRAQEEIRDRILRGDGRR